MTKTEILNLIADHTREILPGLDAHRFDGSDRLVDLGANSVDRAEIAMLVQESLGLSVPRVELFGPKNIGELADLFLKKLHAA
jgi:polyketide biosynthesis acyl carrier protein